MILRILFPEMTSSRASAFGRSLRRLPVPLSRMPIKMRRNDMPPPQARLHIIRNLVMDLFREERIEIQTYKAFESRPYAERLLQLAVVNGLQDDYTNKMLNWWCFYEKDLLHKIFKVFVPRYREPYLDGTLLRFTSVYNLPDEYYGRSLTVGRPYVQRWRNYKMQMLELKGNPFPPVISFPIDHSQNLTNVLLRAAAKRSRHEERNPKTESETVVVESQTEEKELKPDDRAGTLKKSYS